MFLLPCDQLPASPKALEHAIEETLRQFCRRAEPMVAIGGSELRKLDRITVDLSGAVLDPPHRPGPYAGSDVKPAIFVRELAVSGDPIKILGNELVLELRASDVELDEAKGPMGGIFLVLRKAATGEVRVAIERVELEELIAKAAAIAAQKQGVTIENVSLELIPRNLKMIDARVTVTARKLMFRAILKLSGGVAVSDNLVATISNLRCEGDGTIAALACAAITPHFRKIEGRAFPLSALPIGEVRLRDVECAVDQERVTVTAQFGSESGRSGMRPSL